MSGYVRRLAAPVVAAALVAAAVGCGSARTAAAQARTGPRPAVHHTSTSRAVQHRALPPMPARVLLHVPALSQLPELPNGCEITSLAMLLLAVGHPVPTLTLAGMQPVDPTPPTFRPGGAVTFDDVVRWGDPEVGFVGSVYGHGIGYGIYHRPLAALLDRLLPGRSIDLTGHGFDAVLRRVAAGVPVLVWDTVTFAPTDDWAGWEAADGNRVRATQEEHAVLVVGYDSDHVFVNNPLTGQAAEPVARAGFVAAWAQLGSQALTVG